MPSVHSPESRLEPYGGGSEVPLYLLNLDRRPDRLRKALDSLKRDQDQRILRFRAYDRENPEDVSFLENVFQANASEFPHGLGSFCHRYSFCVIFRYAIESGHQFFAIAEDDIDFFGCSRQISFACDAIDRLSADVFFLSGWDYLPKRSAFGRFSRVKQTFCTLGTAFSVYSRSGAERILDLITSLPEFPLDQAIAQLSVDGEILGLGYSHNPYRQLQVLGTDIQSSSSEVTKDPMDRLRSAKKDVQHYLRRTIINRIGI